MTKLNLTTSTGVDISAPNESRIAMELSRLPLSGDSFAILSRAQEVYIQTARSDGGGFTLEYRDGSEEKHFCSTDENLPIDLVTGAFLLYAADDPAWRELTSWVALNDLPSGRLPAKFLALILVPFIGAVIFWIYFLANRA